MIGRSWSCSHQISANHFIYYKRKDYSIVTLHASSIPRELYKNKFESSETPARTKTVSVNCNVYCRSNDDQTWKVFRSEISAVSMTVHLSWNLDSCRQTFNAHFQGRFHRLGLTPQLANPRLRDNWRLSTACIPSSSVNLTAHLTRDLTSFH